MFGRKTTHEVPKPAPEPKPGGKGRPTPKRKDQEAARKRPLVPNDRKEAARRSREAERQQRMKAREAMMTGDERYLQPRDKGPQRRFTRDFVDSRRSVGEYFMILALVVIFFGFFQQTPIGNVAQFALYLVVLILVVDSIVVVVLLNRRLKQKFETRERGLNFYAIMRNMQIRRLRLPKPMVKRGEKPQ